MQNANLAGLTLHVAASLKEILDIQKFRYEVYAAEMSMDFPGIDHSSRTLADALDLSAVHIYATAEGAIAGAVRLNCNTVPAGLEDCLQSASLPKPFAYCSRFCVLKEQRGGNVMEQLVRASFAHFRKLKAQVAICHCYPRLFKLYRRMGFELYGTPFVVPHLEHLGEQTPMRCSLMERASEAA